MSGPYRDGDGPKKPDQLTELRALYEAAYSEAVRFRNELLFPVNLATAVVEIGEWMIRPASVAAVRLNALRDNREMQLDPRLSYSVILVVAFMSSDRTLSFVKEIGCDRAVFPPFKLWVRGWTVED